MEPKDDVERTLTPCPPCGIRKCRADGQIGVHPIGCDDDPELIEDESKRAAAENTRDAK